MRRRTKPELSANVLGLAQDIHDGLIKTLDDPEAFNEAMNENKANYPYKLFGNLALHLTRTELRQNASNAERAEGVVTALQEILKSPSLLEKIAGTPYEATDPQATALQEKVSKLGHLEYSMIPRNRMVQLIYATSKPIRNGLRKSKIIPKDTEITLKLVSSERQPSWNVQQYGHRSAEGVYSKFRGNKKYTVDDALCIAAITSSAELPEWLTELTNGFVRIGQVTTGSLLHLGYDFRRETKEVPGHEPNMTHQIGSIREATLTQAYYGESRNYPLFLSDN